MIGVLPAAGRATRLGLTSGSKELVEIGGTPLIEWAVRRMEAAGCSEIRVVTRPDKEDVRRYAQRRGLDVVLGRPEHVGASVALALAGVDAGESVALAFPDTLWEPLDGFALLAERVDGRSDVALGLFETADASRSDVVVVRPDGTVADVVVKPSGAGSALIWGCLVARAAVLAHADRKSELSDMLRPAIREGRVTSRILSDRWLDVGVPEALDRARSGAFPRARL